MPNLRPLAAEDFDAWLPLWQGYLTFYETALPSSRARDTFDRLIDPQGDIDGFGWWSDEGKLLGMVTYLFHANTWSQKPRCYLNDLFTVPEARGKGVGGELIIAVYEAAAAKGADQVYWTTQEFNSTARVLYDKVADKTPFIKYAKPLG